MQAWPLVYFDHMAEAARFIDRRTVTSKGSQRAHTLYLTHRSGSFTALRHIMVKAIPFLDISTVSQKEPFLPGSRH